MATRSGKKPRGKGASAPKKRRAAPALGNDPFERGAAPRAPVVVPEPRIVAPPEPVVVPEAQVVVPPEPQPPPTAAAASPEPHAAPPSRPSPPPAGALDGLRARLDAAEARIEADLQRAAEVAAATAARLGQAAREELPRSQLGELAQAALRLGPALRDRLAALGSLRRLVAGGEVDAYGMDAELVGRVQPLVDFLYESFWRVELRGMDHLPADGPLIVVANHGGVLPWDALVLREALRRLQPHRRQVRPLLDDAALSTPVAGALALRLGAVRASPGAAQELLGTGAAVLVFPEGSGAPGRPWSERYRIEAFGRGGFAKLAFRTGAAIVPCAIVGSEEASPPLARRGWAAQALGVPILAGAPGLPLGPLSMLPLPSRWSVRFGPPVELGEGGAAAADDVPRVLDATERAREALQRMLDDDVAARRSIYL